MSEMLCGPQCHHELKQMFGPGAWQQEPDRVDFQHAGLPCLLHRNHHGTWCGYAGVAPGHPAFGKGYDAVEVAVHGGLTYAATCSPPICHVPEPGEPGELWWLGFDCGHLFDLVPGLLANLETIGLGHHRQGHLEREVYRDVAYVRRETEALAEQLAAMTKIDSEEPR